MEPTVTTPSPHETPAHTQPPVPVMDVVPAVRPAPPVEDADPESKTPPDKTRKEIPKNKPKQPAAVKKPKDSVGMAIAATVIIVLSLATLATYAFLKTQN